MHNFLGIDLDCSSKGKVSQIKSLSGILRDFNLFEKIDASAATPAANHLFKVRDPEDAQLLEQRRADVLHTMTAQLLLLSQQSRRDIKTVVSFVTTRVKCPDDWGKL